MGKDCLPESQHTQKDFFSHQFKAGSSKSICSRAGDSKVNGQVWPEFEPVEELTPVLITCKFDDDPIKTGVVIMSTTPQHFLHYKSITFFDTQELVQDFMPVLFICKFEEDAIRTECAVVSTIFFSDAQRQVTPTSIDGRGRNSKSSEILWLSWLPASLMTIRSNSRRYCVNNIFSIISVR